MKLRNTVILIPLFVFVLSVSFGCARYATSDEKIVEIEKKISIGVSESEFTKNIPTAQLVDEKENKKLYVVVVSETCFFCGSAKGFQRSFETYATKFTFEDGKLISFKRIANGG
jgi:thioredoxin-related protein